MNVVFAPGFSKATLQTVPVERKKVLKKRLTGYSCLVTWTLRTHKNAYRSYVGFNDLIT